MECVDVNFLNRIPLESGSKRWGDMYFLLLCSDQLEEESRKGNVLAVGIASLEDSIKGCLFCNQLKFLAFSTSSKSFSLGVPHSAQNLLLFPACSLYNKNMPQEAMKIPWINIKTYELQISSFFQASPMDQSQTFLPKINHAFILQKQAANMHFFSMHQASFHVYGFIISTSFS